MRETERQRQRDRDTERERVRETETETETETERQRQREGDRETDRQTDRQRIFIFLDPAYISPNVPDVRWSFGVCHLQTENLAIIFLSNYIS